MRQSLMFFRKMMKFLLIMSWSYTTRKSLKALSTGLEQVIRIFASAISNTCLWTKELSSNVAATTKFQMAKEKQVWKLEKPSTSREEIQTFPKILDKTCQMLVLQDKDTFGNTTLQLLQQRCDLALTSWNTKVTDFFFIQNIDCNGYI